MCAKEYITSVQPDCMGRHSFVIGDLKALPEGGHVLVAGMLRSQTGRKPKTEYVKGGGISIEGSDREAFGLVLDSIYRPLERCSKPPYKD